MELTFGEQIKIMLKRKNMTIRQLAELVEVQTGKPMSRQNLTQKLNRDNFQEQDMKEIAQALGCAVKISVIDQAEPSAQGAAAAQADAVDAGDHGDVAGRGLGERLTVEVIRGGDAEGGFPLLHAADVGVADGGDVVIRHAPGQGSVGDDAAAVVHGYYNSSMVSRNETVGGAAISTADYYWITTDVYPVAGS